MHGVFAEEETGILRLSLSRLRRRHTPSSHPKERRKTHLLASGHGAVVSMPPRLILLITKSKTLLLSAVPPSGYEAYPYTTSNWLTQAISCRLTVCYIVV